MLTLGRAEHQVVQHLLLLLGSVARGVLAILVKIKLNERWGGRVQRLHLRGLVFLADVPVSERHHAPLQAVLLPSKWFGLELFLERAAALFRECVWRVYAAHSLESAQSLLARILAAAVALREVCCS